MPKGIGTFLIAQWLPQFHRAIPSAALDESLFSFMFLGYPIAIRLSSKKTNRVQVSDFIRQILPVHHETVSPFFQMGQMKSFGSSSPSYSYPQTRQRQIVFPLAAFAEGWGFGLI